LFYLLINSCKQTVEKISECNKFIKNAISDVYYFINDRINEYVVFHAKHIPKNGDENAKLVISEKKVIDEYYASENVDEIVFTCGEKPDYENKLITYSNNRIDLPIMKNDVQSTLTIKSTNDYNNTKEENEVTLCSIANNMLKIARPIQVCRKNNNKH